jgi:hypothetical protein
MFTVHQCGLDAYTIIDAGHAHILRLFLLWMGEDAPEIEENTVVEIRGTFFLILPKTAQECDGREVCKLLYRNYKGGESRDLFPRIGFKGNSESKRDSLARFLADPKPVNKRTRRAFEDALQRRLDYYKASCVLANQPVHFIHHELRNLVSILSKVTLPLLNLPDSVLVDRVVSGNFL